MKRKGIPKKCIGPNPGSWERSIHKRQFKGVVITLNAAERSTYGYMSASLCGIKEGKEEKKYEKEVKEEHRQSFISQDAHVRGSLWIAQALWLILAQLRPAQ